MRSVHETIFAVEKNEVLRISVCVLTHVGEGVRVRACVRVWVWVHERGRVLVRV